MKKKLLKGLKITITGLPLAAASAASFFPVQKLTQQCLMLFVLVWVQVFFLFNFAG
jgi:hypothetical protein